MTANAATLLPAHFGARLLAALVVAMAAALVLSPHALAAPTNDNMSVPFNVDLNGGPVTISGGTFGATSEAGEPLTPTGSGACGTRQMVATTWYRILGNGGTVTVTTAGSDFDTVISAYLAPTPSLSDGLPCNDDSADLTSAMSFQSVAGRAYLIQVGGCTGTGCGAAEGNLVLNVTATDPPPPPVITLPPPPPPPPPPDADLDGIPENGADKCPGVKPTRDANRDGCQDKPKRILSDLSYDFRYLRRGAAIRGIRFSGVKLTRAPKGARVSVTCRRCRTSRGRGVRSYSFTARRVGTQSMRPLNGVQLLRRAQLTVVVTSPGRLGRRIVVTMGRRRDVVKLSCLAEGSRTRRVPCSTGS